MKCEYCGQQFEAKRADARYCTDAHRKAAKRGQAKADSPDTAVTADQGDVRDKLPVAEERASPFLNPPMTREEMLAEAKRLTKLQVKERGIVDYKGPHGQTKVVGPYVPTPERETRAARILSLRRAAAR